MNVRVNVELINVGKRFKDKELFTGITQAVRPGQCLAITGKNGSGKSTLLKIIAGIMRPTTGAVQITAGGQVLGKGERLQHIGMVSPEIILYNNLTGCENIKFLAGARGAACGEAQARRLCGMVGLASHGDKLVGTYSTGMKQRLKFALLLAVNPGLWLLDEPSSNLDSDGKALVDELIHTALAQEKTLIVATNEAMEVRHAEAAISLG
ncbi:ABC transporter ATP-binding protein [Sporolituus thermophilus]|uniref:Heme exporter protein A n=1 Tax=Sporolituus thermophilus DSM 23256 TaxID=1123285 RepID=A0A1G7LYP9_9FIRM|nr:ABC transporter ATP-binding protein [Sporolituus thermophilus]SDF54573.1 heme exporter protein A [Sporolituus thermophilus DSM 23256]